MQCNKIIVIKIGHYLIGKLNLSYLYGLFMYKFIWLNSSLFQVRLYINF